MKRLSWVIIAALALVLFLGSIYTYFAFLVPLEHSIHTKKQTAYADQQFLQSNPIPKKSTLSAPVAVPSVPDNADMNTFLLDFNQLLTKYHVILQNMIYISKVTSATKLPDQVMAISYNVKVMGRNSHDMLGFIHELENMPRFLTIDSIEIINQGKNPNATFDMILYWHH